MEVCIRVRPSARPSDSATADAPGRFAPVLGLLLVTPSDVFAVAAVFPFSLAGNSRNNDLEPLCVPGIRGGVRPVRPGPIQYRE